MTLVGYLAALVGGTLFGGLAFVFFASLGWILCDRVWRRSVSGGTPVVRSDGIYYVRLQPTALKTRPEEVL